MASEVRSWILEMGSKREETALMPASTGKEDLSRYLLVARVVGARQTGVVSSGPFAFIQAETPDDRKPIYIMAMGAPRSKLSNLSSRAETSPLQAGDVVGVYRGLTWEVDLPMPQSLHTDQETSENDRFTNPNRRWLVAMEWDLV